MDPDVSLPPTPGLPLFPVSPERTNQQRLPQSPSLPASLADRLHHVRTTSDVQSKVAAFNNLSRDVAERRRFNEAALKRAVVGREAAEEDLKRVKKDMDEWRHEAEERRIREKKIMERLETVMDDLHHTKESHAHAQALYEKEIRRARKEAFKASSTMVKIQEELQATRSAHRIVKAELDLQKVKTTRNEQDCFQAQDELVAVHEELERTQEKLKIIEEEKDTLKNKLEREEVETLASSGALALPSSPRKKSTPRLSVQNREISPSPMSRRLSFKENVDPELQIASELEKVHMEEMNKLRLDLDWERRRADTLDDMIDFLKMECQFKRCSCRIAESRGAPYIHDQDADTLRSLYAGKYPSPISTSFPIPEELIVTVDPVKSDVKHEPKGEDTEFMTVQAEPRLSFSPNSGTFHAVPPTEDIPEAPVDILDEPIEPLMDPEAPAEDYPTEVEPQIMEGEYVAEDEAQFEVLQLEAQLEGLQLEASQPEVQQLEAQLEGLQLEAPQPDVSQLEVPQPEEIISTEVVPDEVEQLMEQALDPEELEARRLALPLSPTESSHSHSSQKVLIREVSPLDGQGPPQTPKPALLPPILFRATPKTIGHASTARIPLTDAFPTTITMTREEMLEAIKRRRGRARSLAANSLAPRKPMIDPGEQQRRDISAPALSSYNG
ncbi:MAG: hypothetical protein M1834_006019 [Cirrosporium novae-zelandiae]|nr:MAG: hypothetical protein M1834_006019 [Cirrosporium novae-zelandiae]